MPRSTRTAAPKPAPAAATTRTRKAAASRPKPAAPATPFQAPSHDDIARLAHELFVSSGQVPGRDVEFWLEAERRLKHGVKV